ncbi:MAG: DUF1848 domain-containing protein [Candidatus Margulisbacteria bacterium]|nr:DUF1848 domain-containing protein [Candidatus Margulisiibacteriota bacterium]
MNWKQKEIILDNGNKAISQAPIIVSASRSTDIPAFYSDWFFHRLDIGYSAWTNPFNGLKSYISYENTRLIVFWSKNPKPLLAHLYKLKERSINCYIQYTLNDYDVENFERGVPPVAQRIDTFKQIVDKLGKGSVIWRFDPLILTNKVKVEDLLEKAKHIGDQLSGYTEKMVFSFADIANYRKVRANLEKSGVNYREFSEDEMHQFSRGISENNKAWGYELTTCGEKIDLLPYGIQHNRCVDDDLMIKLFPDDKILMDFLGVEIQHPDLFNNRTNILKTKNNKDKGQRQFCGCIVSKDIGEYNTCPHLCDYCYANDADGRVKANWNQHLKNNKSETITGR